MFSPLNDPQLEQWFERFNAPLKRLPAEERAALHLEVRQHLEALATAKIVQGQPSEAALQEALNQFGDPKRIGQKMYHEWRQGRTGFRADMAAIFFGAVLVTLAWFVEQPLLMFLGNSKFFSHDNKPYGLPIVVTLTIFYSVRILITVALGRKYPFQAIKGICYAYILSTLWLWAWLAIAVFRQHLNQSPPLSVVFARSLLWMPPYLAGYMAVAYLASVTKRGWYRPTWADFKLSLPRRRPQLSR